MSDIYNRSLPFSQNRYRQDTDKVAVKMAGVEFKHFTCPECKKIKPLLGRKSRGHKAVFRCIDCHEAKNG